MKQKQQEAQEKRLRGAVSLFRREKRELRGAEASEPKPPIRLTPDAKLTGAEKRRLTAAFKKAWKDGKVPRTAQQTIPYQEMCRDGICVVNDHYFTKQIQFFDITYQLAQNEDKNQIFESYCEFLNYFDSSIHVQLSFLNQRTDMEEFQHSIHIEEQPDEFNPVRVEFSDMLEGQMGKGNNGLTKTKYITFGIEAASLKEAKPRLERIEADILANFKALGVRANSLSGYERLAILHRMFHPNGDQKFRFAWDAIWQTGLSSKDFIAPDSFTFKSGNTFKIGATYGTVSFLQILAPELTDRMLADLLDLEGSMVVTLHIQSIDQSAAIKNIKRKITDLDSMKIQEQMKAVRAGYDMDIIPSDLTTYGAEARTLLEDLQSRNERMFLVTVLVMNTSENARKLGTDFMAAKGVAQKYNCALRRLDWQQEQGLMSSLPLGLNQINIQRGLTTSSTAIFVPFTTEELFMGGEALYYGLNALSNNLIMADRKKLKNPNFSAKREITNAFLITQDDISIIDPEDEYSALVQRLGGQVIDISPTSDQFINPMDITLNYSEDDSPLALKSDFILSLMELIVGGKSGLEPVEKTIIDRCVHLVYREYLQDPRPEKMPMLGDLHALLCQQTEPEAQRLATALEIYVSGSLNVFNHRTNVKIQAVKETGDADCSGSGLGQSKRKPGGT